MRPSPLTHPGIVDPTDLRGALAGRLFADLRGAATGAPVLLARAEIGPARHIGSPLRLSRTRLRTAGPALLLGAHAQGVLVGLPGMEPFEVARRTEEGVRG